MKHPYTTSLWDIHVDCGGVFHKTGEPYVVHSVYLRDNKCSKCGAVRDPQDSEAYLGYHVMRYIARWKRRQEQN